ncbi:trigger factor [Granulicella cerasi]|uniref:Trigger factor n=1 Tax=Granulicella cerasi TaxID=741063 RepID=A0ABW1Z4Q1_9BACT|nr:trigger factor [Granulicella cerasi]
MTPTETQDAAANNTPAHEEHNHDHSHEGHDHHHGPALNPELTKTIHVEAPTEDVNKAFASVSERYKKLARIPGFRAGKVPASLIKGRFAKEIRQEVLESLIAEKFRTALEAEKLQPISQPQVSELLLAEGAPLKFTATFEVLPEIDVTGYEAVTATRPESVLSDDEFELEITSVLEHHATVEPVEEERAIVDGDWAEIGFTGNVQSVAQTVTEDGLDSVANEQPITGEDVLIEIGGKNTLAAFSDSIRGTKVGQEIETEVVYPEDFGDPRLAGKTVKYDVTVKAIKKKTYPERDAELAKQLGPYEDWADFETKLRERAANRKKQSVESGAKDEMVEQLVEKFAFPVPEFFVQQQIDARLERGLRALAQQGMTQDAMRQLDFARLREANRDQAIAEVKASLILDKVAAAEGVTISDEDMERELLMLSIQYREPLETLRARLEKDGTIQRIRESILRERTVEQLYAKLAK